MSNEDGKDPLKIELENLKLEIEANLEDDPLKLDQDLSTPIKTEQTFVESDDHEITKQRHKNSKKNLQCDECVAKFQYYCALNAHTHKIHKKNKLDFHKCDFCDLRLTNLLRILIHLKNVHEGLPLPHCKLCNKCFENKTKLEEHIDIIHRGNIPKCDICVKEFKSKKIFDTHV